MSIFFNVSIYDVLTALVDNDASMDLVDNNASMDLVYTSYSQYQS